MSRAERVALFVLVAALLAVTVVGYSQQNGQNTATCKNREAISLLATEVYRPDEVLPGGTRADVDAVNAENLRRAKALVVFAGRFPLC